MVDKKQKYDLEWPYDMKELLLHVHMLTYIILVHYLTHYMLVACILKKTNFSIETKFKVGQSRAK